MEQWIESQLAGWGFEILAGIVLLVVGTMIARFFYIPQIRQMRKELAEMRQRSEPLPVKAEIKYEYSIAYWTDPKDGERKQVWIPRVWLEYENGARKMLEIDGLVENQNMTLFPLGPIDYSENAPDESDQTATE